MRISQKFKQDPSLFERLDEFASIAQQRIQSSAKADQLQAQPEEREEIICDDEILELQRELEQKAMLEEQQRDLPGLFSARCVAQSTQRIAKQGTQQSLVRPENENSVTGHLGAASAKAKDARLIYIEEIKQ